MRTLKDGLENRVCVFLNDQKIKMSLKSGVIQNYHTMSKFKNKMH